MDGTADPVSRIATGGGMTLDVFPDGSTGFKRVDLRRPPEGGEVFGGSSGRRTGGGEGDCACAPDELGSCGGSAAGAANRVARGSPNTFRLRSICARLMLTKSPVVPSIVGGMCAEEMHALRAVRWNVKE